MAGDGLKVVYDGRTFSFGGEFFFNSFKVWRFFLSLKSLVSLCDCSGGIFLGESLFIEKYTIMRTRDRQPRGMEREK